MGGGVSEKGPRKRETSPALITRRKTSKSRKKNQPGRSLFVRPPPRPLFTGSWKSAFFKRPSEGAPRRFCRPRLGQGCNLLVFVLAIAITTVKNSLSPNYTAPHFLNNYIASSAMKYARRHIITPIFFSETLNIFAFFNLRSPLLGSFILISPRVECARFLIFHFHDKNILV